MTAYRRARISGGCYFFTVALADRRSTALVDRIAVLRDAVARTRRARPFRIDAMVVLPDHLHAVWTLPEGDADYSTRWGAIKGRFSRDLRRMGLSPATVPPSKRERGEADVWHRRFWEHAIRDDRDHDAHSRYCWANPVRHGFCARPAHWPHSSIHRDIRLGRVEPEWAEAGDAPNPAAFGEP